MLTYLNDDENELADFVNQGPSYTRALSEIESEFVERGWSKARMFKAINKLLSDKPRVLTSEVDNELGERTYSTTNVMYRNNDAGEID